MSQGFGGLQSLYKKDPQGKSEFTEESRETTCDLRDIEAVRMLFRVKSSRARVKTASTFCRLILSVWSAPTWSVEETKASQYKTGVCSGCLLKRDINRT
jgi:hypothetical protein